MITELKEIPTVLRFRIIFKICGALTRREPYTKAYPTNFESVYIKNNLTSFMHSKCKKFF